MEFIGKYARVNGSDDKEKMSVAGGVRQKLILMRNLLMIGKVFRIRTPLIID